MIVPSTIVFSIRAELKNLTRSQLQVYVQFLKSGTINNFGLEWCVMWNFVFFFNVINLSRWNKHTFPCPPGCSKNKLFFPSLKILLTLFWKYFSIAVTFIETSQSTLNLLSLIQKEPFDLLTTQLSLQNFFPQITGVQLETYVSSTNIHIVYVMRVCFHYLQLL